MWWVQKFGVSFSMVMSKRVRDVEQKERLDTAILEFVILRGSLLSRCKTLVRALSCRDLSSPSCEYSRYMALCVS